MADVEINIDHTTNIVVVKVGSDAGVPTTETDPTVPSAVKEISAVDITKWNAEVGLRQEADSLLNQSIDALQESILTHQTEVTEQLNNKVGTEDFIQASKIQGTLNPDQIPYINISKPPVYPVSGALSSLTEEEEDEISKGTTVYTNDGKRWSYKGVGDKTLQASYTELADVTPGWNSIEGKPATFPAAPHTHTMAEVLGLLSAFSNENAARTLNDGQIRSDLSNEITERQNSFSVLETMMSEIANKIQLTQLLRPL